jgi:hypothetical protein
MKRKFRDIVVALAAAFAIMACGTEAMAQSAEYDFYSYDDTPKVRMEWGVGVGATYTGLSHVSTNMVELKPRFGIAGHFDMAVRIGRNFAIETEICYEGGSVNASALGLNRKVRTHTMDIPVLLSARLVNNRIRISAGPLFTVMSRAEYTLNSETMFFGSLYPTWNLAAGVGVGIGRHLVIEARYVHPLKSNHNSFNGIEFSTRAYRVTAGLTLMF